MPAPRGNPRRRSASTPGRIAAARMKARKSRAISSSQLPEREHGDDDADDDQRREEHAARGVGHHACCGPGSGGANGRKAVGLPKPQTCPRIGTSTSAWKCAATASSSRARSFARAGVAIAGIFILTLPWAAAAGVGAALIAGRRGVHAPRRLAVGANADRRHDREALRHQRNAAPPDEDGEAAGSRRGRARPVVARASSWATGRSSSGR